MRDANTEGTVGRVHALMNRLRRVPDAHIGPDDRMQRETVKLADALSAAARRRERA